jgi:hypothetical protein
MNTEKFIETMVTIDLQDEGKAFGHYPFQLISIDNENKVTAAVLFLGGDVVGVYKAVKKVLSQGSVKLFLSIDFPALGDINKDFIAVYTLTDRFVECVAIPYDTNTGNRHPLVKTGKTVYGLKKQFESLVLF